MEPSKQSHTGSLSLPSALKTVPAERRLPAAARAGVTGCVGVSEGGVSPGLGSVARSPQVSEMFGCANV